METVWDHDAVSARVQKYAKEHGVPGVVSGPGDRGEVLACGWMATVCVRAEVGEGFSAFPFHVLSFNFPLPCLRW